MRTCLRVTYRERTPGKLSPFYPQWGIAFARIFDYSDSSGVCTDPAYLKDNTRGNPSLSSTSLLTLLATLYCQTWERVLVVPEQALVPTPVADHARIPFGVR